MNLFIYRHTLPLPFSTNNQNIIRPLQLGVVFFCLLFNGIKKHFSRILCFLVLFYCFYVSYSIILLDLDRIIHLSPKKKRHSEEILAGCFYRSGIFQHTCPHKSKEVSTYSHNEYWKMAYRKKSPVNSKH